MADSIYQDNRKAGCCLTYTQALLPEVVETTRKVPIPKYQAGLLSVGTATWRLDTYISFISEFVDESYGWDQEILKTLKEVSVVLR